MLSSDCDRNRLHMNSLTGAPVSADNDSGLYPLYSCKDTVYPLIGVVQLGPALLQDQRPEICIVVGPSINQLIILIDWEVIINYYFLIDTIIS